MGYVPIREIKALSNDLHFNLNFIKLSLHLYDTGLHHAHLFLHMSLVNSTLTISYYRGNHLCVLRNLFEPHLQEI